MFYSHQKGLRDERRIQTKQLILEQVVERRNDCSVEPLNAIFPAKHSGWTKWIQQSKYWSEQISGVTAGICSLCWYAQGSLCKMTVTAAKGTMQLFLEAEAGASVSYQLKPASRWAWFKLTEVTAKISSTFSGLWTSPAQSNPVSVGVGDGRHPAFFPLCELTLAICMRFFSPGWPDLQPGALCICPRLWHSGPKLGLSIATRRESPARRLNHM